MDSSNCSDSGKRTRPAAVVETAGCTRAPPKKTRPRRQRKEEVDHSGWQQPRRRALASPEKSRGVTPTSNVFAPLMSEESEEEDQEEEDDEEEATEPEPRRNTLDRKDRSGKLPRNTLPPNPRKYALRR